MVSNSGTKPGDLWMGRVETRTDRERHSSSVSYTIEETKGMASFFSSFFFSISSMVSCWHESVTDSFVLFNFSK